MAWLRDRRFQEDVTHEPNLLSGRILASLSYYSLKLVASYNWA